MNNKVMTLGFCSVFIFLMFAFNNCSNPIKTTSTGSVSENSGGTTVGTPLVEFKFAAFASPDEQPAVTFCIDQIVLTLDDGNGTQLTVPVPTNERNLSKFGTSIGVQAIPAGNYALITIPLSTQCLSHTSLQVTNTQGSFMSAETVNLSFSGRALLDRNLMSISLDIQNLVNSLNNVKDNAVLVTAAESASGTWSASNPNVWFKISEASSPSPRHRHTAVRAGSKMIVWGGLNEFQTPSLLNTGGIYDLATNSWTITSTASAPTGREHHIALWTGSKMIIWGGEDVNGNTLGDGALYDPGTDTWAPVSMSGAPSARAYPSVVWTGTKMLLWGGLASDGSKLNNGGQYDPLTNKWTSITLTGAPSSRMHHSAIWTGSRLLIWGGCISASAECPGDATALNSGGLYDPASDSWQSISLTSSPTARYNHTAVWTGSEMLVWGGEGHSPGNHFYIGDGARYNPANDTWAPMSDIGAASQRTYHTGLWSGAKMIIWGGRDNGEFLNSGAQYDPVSDIWSSLAIQDSPTARIEHSAIWTGTEMVIWGGWNNVLDPVVSSTGGRYIP